MGSNNFKVAVLASGRGSNFKALLGKQDNYQIVALISDKADAYALEIAKEAGVKTVKSFPRSAFNSKAEQKQAIYSELDSVNPDLICLAGYMQIIEPEFANQNHGRIINIHPALLPRFTGLDTHKRALESKETIHGCSVHYVDAGLDTGPLIAQASCPILTDDNEETLAKRVLALEHKLYPLVVNGIASEEIKLKEDGRVWIAEELARRLGEF